MYKNAFENCYEEMKTYYPVWYREIKEMDAIWRTNSLQLDNMQKGIVSFLMNNFVYKADEKTIFRWEQFLYIRYNEYPSLDERRKMIVSFFLSNGHFGEKEIKEILSLFTDAKITVELVGGTVYISAYRDVADKYNLAEGFFIFYKKIPAHLQLFFIDVMDPFSFSTENVFNTKSFSFNGKAFFYGDNIIKLDGKYLLDGSWILNQEFTKNFRFKRFEVKGINAETSADSSIKQYIFDGINIKNKRSESKPTSFIFAGRSKEDTYEDIKELSIDGFGSIADMSFSGVELIKDSMWKLDGNINLNGSRLLNADIIKEVI